MYRCYCEKNILPLLICSLPCVRMNDSSLARIWALSESHVSTPTDRDTVYNDECMFTFATTEHGLYVNLKTWKAFSSKYLPVDLAAHNNVGVYLYVKRTEIIADQSEFLVVLVMRQP